MDSAAKLLAQVLSIYCCFNNVPEATHQLLAREDWSDGALRYSGWDLSTSRL